MSARDRHDNDATARIRVPIGPRAPDRYRFLSIDGEICIVDAAEIDPDASPAAEAWSLIGRHARERARQFLVTTLVLVAGCSFWPGSAMPSGGPTPDGPPAMLDGAGSGGGGGADAVPDAPAAIVTLSETAGTNVTPGASVVCYAPGGTSTVDGEWYRVFSHVDHVTAVGFATDKAYRATSVTVTVGTYGGTMGGATLASSQIASLGAFQATVPDSDAPQGVTVNLPAAVAIPSGALVVVEVASGDLTGWGYFFLGATQSAQSEPGYFASEHGCGAWPAGNPPAATPSGSGHLVIEAQGY